MSNKMSYMITEVCNRHGFSLEWYQDDDLLRALIKPPIDDETELLITFNDNWDIVQIAYRENGNDWTELPENYNITFSLLWSEIHRYDQVTNKFSSRRLVAFSKASHCDWMDYIFYKEN